MVADMLTTLKDAAQVPFVLTPSAKQQILRMEARMQQAVIGQSYSDQASPCVAPQILS